MPEDHPNMEERLSGQISERLSVTIPPFNTLHFTDRYVSWLNDAEVTKYSEQRHKTHTTDSCRAYWQSMKGHEFRAIEYKGVHVGNIAGRIDQNNGVVDVSILIGEKSLWGNHIGSQAWEKFTTELLRTYRKVTAGTMELNLGMRRIMDKYMVPDGVKQRHFLFEGREINAVYGAMWGPIDDGWDGTGPGGA